MADQRSTMLLDLKQRFEHWDTDHDGRLKPEEVFAMLQDAGMAIPVGEVDQLLADFGNVNFDELCLVWEHTQELSEEQHLAAPPPPLPAISKPAVRHATPNRDPPPLAATRGPTPERSGSSKVVRLPGSSMSTPPAHPTRGPAAEKNRALAEAQPTEPADRARVSNPADGVREAAGEARARAETARAERIAAAEAANEAAAAAAPQVLFAIAPVPHQSPKLHCAKRGMGLPQAAGPAADYLAIHGKGKKGIGAAKKAPVQKKQGGSGCCSKPPAKSSKQEQQAHNDWDQRTGTSGSIYGGMAEGNAPVANEAAAERAADAAEAQAYEAQQVSARAEVQEAEAEAAAVAAEEEAVAAEAAAADGTWDQAEAEQAELEDMAADIIQRRWRQTKDGAAAKATEARAKADVARAARVATAEQASRARVEKEASEAASTAARERSRYGAVLARREQAEATGAAQGNNFGQNTAYLRKPAPAPPGKVKGRKGGMSEKQRDHGLHEHECSDHEADILAQADEAREVAANIQAEAEVMALPALAACLCGA
jgi:hypothetical protein